MILMRSPIRYVAVFVLSVCAAKYGVAQTPASDSAASFAPLLQWKNAVLSGDRVGLKALYSTAPPAKVTVPPAESSPDADVDFWAGLKARSVDLDNLQSTSPQAGVQVVQFQAEIQAGVPPKNETLYVSEAQAWQQQGSEWRLVVVQRTNAAHLMQPANKDKNIYPADADARAEIKEAEEEAAKEHKRVLLVFGANWCYDCHVLDLAFNRADFAPVMAGYRVVHVDIGPDGKKNADLAKQFQVPLDKGVPALAVADSEGKVLVSQKNGEFENARAMTPQALLEFLNKWKPQAR
jgi:thioredoxin 1